MPARLISDTPDVSMVHQSSGDESNVAKATNPVASSSANAEMPNVAGRLIDVKINELQQDATDATIAAMQRADGAEAEGKGATDGSVPKGTDELQRQERWLTQVQNIDELVHV